MKKIVRFWKVIVLDSLGVLFMVAALLTGWLPGPGGLPLFIIGLSLLAVNHEWAERYIDKLKQYADRLGDYIFVSNRKVQLIYDILAPPAVLAGTWLIVRHSAVWQLSLGIFLTFTGITFILGNRRRWPRIKQHFKRKH